MTTHNQSRAQRRPPPHTKHLIGRALFARFMIGGIEIPNEASYLCRQRLIENIGVKMRNASCDPELATALNGHHSIRILDDRSSAQIAFGDRTGISVSTSVHEIVSPNPSSSPLPARHEHHRFERRRLRPGDGSLLRPSTIRAWKRERNVADTG